MAEALVLECTNRKGALKARASMNYFFCTLKKKKQQQICEFYESFLCLGISEQICDIWLEIFLRLNYSSAVVGHNMGCFCFHVRTRT